MKNFYILRIAVTLISIVAMICIVAISMFGINNVFTDGMILSMNITGGVGIIALVVNAVLSILELPL